MAAFSIASGGPRLAPNEFPEPEIDVESRTGEQAAILAGGCFWCTEAVFKPLAGVLSVTSGYTGDEESLADYRTVCSGGTNHAEAIEVRFDPAVISFGQLLKIFFSVAHDPTQHNRQGADIGPQYRSAVFYADDEQRRVAEAYIAQLEDADAFHTPIATTIEELEVFYPAEEYHQDYAERNPGQPYIAFNAEPKVCKLREYFAEKVEQ